MQLLREDEARWQTQQKGGKALPRRQDKMKENEGEQSVSGV